MVVRAAKQHYLSTFIVTTEFDPVALFKIIQSLLGQESLSNHLQGYADEFVEQLMDKVAHIHSLLESKHGGGPVEAPYLVIWQSLIMLDLMKWAGPSMLSVQLPAI